MDHAVVCDCGFLGMRFDCSHGECPNCGDRVRKASKKELAERAAPEALDVPLDRRIFEYNVQAITFVLGKVGMVA